ncbi:hypothetical protein KIS4809_1993 [Bacillus sp. ZZV12-4809]|nr:hypothetical protein KIS4809_1993 [Bacillus sp. ZZV12-4809]
MGWFCIGEGELLIEVRGIWFVGEVWVFGFCRTCGAIQEFYTIS